MNIGGQEFIKLFLHNQNRIYRFIFTLVPKHSDANDIMQETVLVMWSKFDEYQKGTNFYAWAVRIARNKVMQYRDLYKRKQMLFSPEAIAQIVSVNQSVMTDLDDRMKIMQNCLKKLKEQDRHFLELRYEQNMQIKNIALTVGRSIQGMYKTMGRIHYLLKQCINRTIMTGKGML